MTERNLGEKISFRVPSFTLKSHCYFLAFPWGEKKKPRHSWVWEHQHKESSLSYVQLALHEPRSLSCFHSWYFLTPFQIPALEWFE